MADAPGRPRVAVGCEFRFSTPVAVPAVVLVRGRSEGDVTVESERWEVTPDAGFSDVLDTYANHARRLAIGPGPAVLRYDATVAVSGELDDADPAAHQHRVEDLPGEILIYTLASRYCLSDLTSDLAVNLFGAIPPGWSRVQAICDWVHANVRFDYASSNPNATSADTYFTGTGVCRDFAHLAITFCRALNVPARYVFGYIPGVMDFCAWMEIYLSGRWWTFDPRNNERRAGRVVVARGRDAMDVAMVTSYGQLQLDQMTVRADFVRPPGDGGADLTDGGAQAA